MEEYSFKINSRYGVPRSVVLIDPDRGVFKITGESLYSRGGEDMFDFEGGPFYMVGEQFFDIGEIVSVEPFPTPTPIDENARPVASVLVSINYNKRGLKETKKWRNQNSGQ
jgi:hypothetical protein